MPGTHHAVTSAAAPSNLAALDLGTNSFHLVVARLLENGFEVVTREKETVRLGHGGGDMKELSADAIDRGISSLRRMQRIAASHGAASVRAVATSAVREAQNAEVFLTRARREAKVDIEVISGLEEARLIHLGVLQAVPVFDQRMLMIDIGGGSTEFLVGEGGEVLSARSLKLGAIRLTDRFFRDEPLKPKQVDACRDYVRAYLFPVVRDVRELGFDVCVGSSGTIINLAEMVVTRRGEPGRLLGNASFTREELDEVVDALLKAKTVKDRVKVPGLDPRR